MKLCSQVRQPKGILRSRARGESLVLTERRGIVNWQPLADYNGSERHSNMLEFHLEVSNSGSQRYLTGNRRTRSRVGKRRPEPDPATHTQHCG